jgi:hypothetical protein
MNRERKILLNVVFLLIALCMAGVGWAVPMGTAFTYQGRLVDANSPAEGSYDLRFRLFDDPSGGTQLALVKANDIDVIDGNVTIDLDFGADPNRFNGDARWLEILVRPGASTGFFTTLSPRQELIPTPYALYAKTTGDDGDWTISGNDMYTGASVTGNVGIGTTTPSAKLTVDGAILRNGSTMYGSNADTHINLGTTSTTGTNGQNYLYVTVGGGQSNTASGNHATINGGSNNTASAFGTTVVGGSNNTASGYYATVVGGTNNTVSDLYAIVGGGHYNSADGSYATIGGGYSIIASGDYSTVGGGDNSEASGNYATIAGGNNIAYGDYGAVGGGFANSAAGEYSTVGGGGLNVAIGYAATIPGGYFNDAVGDYSFAAGRKAKANHQGAFVWGDSTDTNFASTGPDQFLIRASGGVGIGTTSPSYDLDVNGDIRAIGSVYYGGTVGNTDGTAYTKPDYVFEDGYDVMSSEQVEEYLKEKNHLPWMTSAKAEKQENGDVIDMTRMAFETVETAENLQIQIIEQNKLIKELKTQNELLNQRLSSLESMMTHRPVSMAREVQ